MFPKRVLVFSACTTNDGHFHVVLCQDTSVTSMRDGIPQAVLQIDNPPINAHCFSCTTGFCALLQWENKIIIWNVSSGKSFEHRVNECLSATLLMQDEMLVLQKRETFVANILTRSRTWDAAGKYVLSAAEPLDCHFAFATSNHFIDVFVNRSSRAASTHFARPIDFMQFLRLSTGTLLCVSAQGRSVLEVFDVCVAQNQSYGSAKPQLLKVASMLIESPLFSIAPTPVCQDRQSLRSKLQVVTLSGAALATAGLRFATGCLPTVDNGIRVPTMLQSILTQIESPIRQIEAMTYVPSHKPDMTRPSAIVDKFFVSAKNELQLLVAFENGFLAQIGIDLGDSTTMITHLYSVGTWGHLTRVQLSQSGRFAAATFSSKAGQTCALFGLGSHSTVLIAVSKMFPLIAVEAENTTQISRESVQHFMEVHCPTSVSKFEILLKACGGSLDKLLSQLQKKYQCTPTAASSIPPSPKKEPTCNLIEMERTISVVNFDSAISFVCDIQPIFAEASAGVFDNVLPFVSSMYTAVSVNGPSDTLTSQHTTECDSWRLASLRGVISRDSVTISLFSSPGADELTLPPCSLPPQAQDVSCYFHDLLETVFVTAHSGSEAFFFAFSPWTHTMRQIPLGACGKGVVTTFPHRRGLIVVGCDSVIHCVYESMRIASFKILWSLPVGIGGAATIVSAAAAGTQLCVGTGAGDIYRVDLSASDGAPPPSLFNPKALYDMYARGDGESTKHRLQQILGTSDAAADPLRTLLYEILPQDLAHDGGTDEGLPILVSSMQARAVGPNSLGDAARAVSSLLPNVVLHDINSTDQLVLTCVTEAIQQTGVTAAGMDVGGTRFVFDFILKQQFKKFRAQAQNPFSSKSVLWGVTSETQDQLLDFVLAQWKSSNFLWQSMCELGCSLWMKSLILLKKAVDNVAKGHYQENQRDCKESALFYILLGKKGILTALFKASNEMKLHQFFLRDFSDPKNKQSATTNAFVAVGKGNVLFGCAFFVLAGDIRGAAQTAIQRLGDWQLALLIIRLATDDNTVDLQWLWTFLETCPEVKLSAWERAGLQWRMSGARVGIKYLLSEGADLEALHIFQHCSKTVPAIKCGEKLLPTSEIVPLVVRASQQCAEWGDWTQAKYLAESAMQTFLAEEAASRAHIPKFAADVNSGTLVFRNDSDDESSDGSAATRGLHQSPAHVFERVKLPCAEVFLKLFCRSVCQAADVDDSTRNPTSLTMSVISSHYGHHSDAESEQRLRQVLADRTLSPALAKTLTFVALAQWAVVHRDLAMCAALVAEGLSLNELFGTAAAQARTEDTASMPSSLSEFITRLSEKKHQIMNQAESHSREASPSSSFDDLSMTSPSNSTEDDETTVINKLLLLFETFVCFQIRHSIVLRKLPLSLAASCLLLHFCDRACHISDRLAIFGDIPIDDNGLFLFIRRQIRNCFLTVAAVTAENENIDRVCYQASRTLCQHLLTSTEHLPDLAPMDLTVPLKQLCKRSETHRGARQLFTLVVHRHREVLTECAYIWSRERQSHQRARSTFLTVSFTRSLALTEKIVLCQQTHEATSVCFDASSYDTIAVATSNGTHLIHGQRDALVRDNESAVDCRAAARKAAAQAFSMKELGTPTTVSPSSANKRPVLGAVTSTLLLSHPHLPFFVGARNSKTLDVFHHGSKDAVSSFEYSGINDCVTAMDFSANGRFLLAGSKNGRVTCWKFASVMEKAQPLFQEAVLSRITAARFLPNLSFAFAVGGIDNGGDNKFAVKIYDGAMRCQSVQQCAVPFRPDYMEFNFSDPAQLVCVSEQGEYVIYDLKSQKVSDPLLLVDGTKKTSVTCFASSQYDPGLFAFGTSKSELALCKLVDDSTSGGGRRVLVPCATTCVNPTHRSSITDVKFSPSSLLFCCNDGKVCCSPLIPEGTRELFL